MWPKNLQTIFICFNNFISDHIFRLLTTLMFVFAAAAILFILDL